MPRTKGLSFYKKKKKINRSLIRDIFSTLFCMAAAVFVAAVVVYFFGMSINVVGVSMEPALYNGQQIFVDRFLYTFTDPRAGDVLVFLPNGNENSHYYVKRVIGVPGDRIQIRQGNCYVNGELSPYVTHRVLEAGIAENELVLELGEYFCMGDDPNNSEDSRSANIGPVKEEDIVGKAWFRLGADMGFIR